MGKLASPACRAIGGFLCLGGQNMGQNPFYPRAKNGGNPYSFFIGRWSRELDSNSRSRSRRSGSRVDWML